MTKEKLTIPIDAIEADFQEFIAPESNKQIIFSGPFGIGKTYFLDKFFKGKNEEYLPVFLRPVNYSLLSNEDIFKLIKYDILYQLIQFPEFKIEEAFSISKGDYTKFFVLKNGFAILSNLLKLIPKIQTAVEAIEKLGELFKAYKDGLEDVNKNSDLKLMFDFQLETQESFLLEFDQVSQLISEQLTEISKSRGSGTKPLQKVLVIDDLDRLDPEHIFRLFNVFSAHFDQVSYYSHEEDNPSDNKFGFDKIIFVCDIENIRKIFAHKYGTGVDFSGYIDKFYSTSIYQFFHKETFEKIINPYFDQKFIFKYKDQSSIEIRSLLAYTMELLFYGKNLSVREINRLSKHKPSFTSESHVIENQTVTITKAGAPENSQLRSYKALLIAKLFIEVFGGKDIFLRKIQNSYKYYSNYHYHDSAYYYNKDLHQLILFSAIEKHHFKLSEEGSDAEIFGYVPVKNVTILFTLNSGYYERYYEEGERWYKINIEKQHTLKISNGTFFKILVDAYTNIIESGILD